jgi:hypothetical protein
VLAGSWFDLININTTRQPPPPLLLLSLLLLLLLPTIFASNLRIFSLLPFISALERLPPPPLLPPPPANKKLEGIKGATR